MAGAPGGRSSTLSKAPPELPLADAEDNNQRHEQEDNKNYHHKPTAQMFLKQWLPPQRS